jgi:hypothetical protein
MANEEIFVTTPLNRKVLVRLGQIGDDVWGTEIVYANQVHRVGRFKGKDHAIEGARKKAIQIADAPPQTAQRISRAPRKKKNKDPLPGS